MTSKASKILMSVMSSIDDLKDKINDGEYLNLCNLLKSLNDEIKTPSETLRQAAIEAIEQMEREAEAESEEQEQEQDDEYSIEQILARYLNNPDYFDNNNNIIVNPREILNGYNSMLLTIEHDQTEMNDYKWFTCACGCCLRTSDISEHIATQEHIENFNYN